MSDFLSLTRRRVLALGFACAASTAMPSLAEETIDAERRKKLFERLKNAATERQGRIAEDEVWRMWMAGAPSDAIGRDVKAAMDARSAYDLDKALGILDSVVQTAPDYAEGWNQRAFIRFLKDDLDGSLEDIDRALELEPKHFAALAGKAIVLMRQGRAELGQQALRQAVAIHPWLRERSMLAPEPGEKSLPDPGKDI